MTLSQADELEDILQYISRYDMRLNPAKCFFGVKARIFLGFMLTMRGIEANPYMFQVVISMRSSTNVKEVKKLMGRLTTLSCFLSCAGDIYFLLFVAPRKKDKFEWTAECEKTFTKVK